jgi:hypothetical protein
MKLDWTRGDKTKAAKEATKQLLVTSKPALDRLSNLCYNKRSAYDKMKYAKPDYNEPAWALVQSDLNGYSRALTEIIELISSIEE